MLDPVDKKSTCALSKQVMDIFEYVDQHTAKFKADTGIRCLPGCGRCCRSTKVEASSLELLPAAEELFRRGDVLAWLDKAADTDNMPCIFYQADPHIDGNGRCQIYPWRPLVCRLFGWVNSRSKYGEKKFSPCSHIKQVFAAQIKSAELSTVKLPCYTDLSSRIVALNPSIGARLLPINQAFQQAANHVGLWLQLMKAQLATVHIRSEMASAITLAALKTAQTLKNPMNRDQRN